MKKTISLLLLVSLFAACKKDFKTIANWEEKMVVYSLVDIREAQQFIKINKAFLGDGNVMKYAENPDSNQYQYPLDVKLLELDENNNIVQTILFDTIHITNKEDGIFYNTDQIIYKSRPYPRDTIIVFTEGFQQDTIRIDTLWLNPSHKYKLDIKNPKTDYGVTSETIPVGFIRYKSPSYTQKFLTLENTEDHKKIIKWFPIDNRNIQEVKIYFHYLELIGADSVKKKINLISERVSASSDYYYFYSTNFFHSCETMIPYKDAGEEANVTKRFSRGIEIQILAGNESFYKYLVVNEPSSGLIQEKPIYSNINDGIGIFASRTKSSLQISIGDGAINTLATDFNLKF